MHLCVGSSSPDRLVRVSDTDESWGDPYLNGKATLQKGWLQSSRVGCDGDNDAAKKKKTERKEKKEKRKDGMTVLGAWHEWQSTVRRAENSGSTVRFSSGRVVFARCDRCGGRMRRDARCGGEGMSVSLPEKFPWRSTWDREVSADDGLAAITIPGGG